jgi:predicted NBD/HSP70 family sugar kinase
MPGWSGVSLRDRFAAILPFPVVIDNDANLGALAEYRWGVAQGVRNVAYLYLGSTGIGAGLVLNGTIYRGEIGSAGEIGHLTIDEDGPRCSCGSYGCLEAVAGMPQLLEHGAALFDGRKLTLDQLVQEAQNNSQAVQELFTTSAKHLGVAVASMLNLYNPGLVVLGGPLAVASNLLLATIRVVAKQRALPITLEHCEIVIGALGTDVVALGAASQIIQNVFSPATFDTLVGQL